MRFGNGRTGTILIDLTDKFLFQPYWLILGCRLVDCIDHLYGTQTVGIADGRSFVVGAGFNARADKGCVAARLFRALPFLNLAYLFAFL